MKFSYVKIGDIYTYLGLKASTLTGKDKEYIQHFLKVLRDQRRHMSIVGFDNWTEDEIIDNFWSYIIESSKVTIPMLKLYEEEMDNILSLDKESSSISLINKEGEDIQEASEDSSLSKENDTPDNVNIDLTSDNYISSSQRTTIDTGKRERITRNIDMVEVTYKEVDNIERVRVLADLEHLISNIYQNWLSIIDKAMLVYYEH